MDTQLLFSKIKPMYNPTLQQVVLDVNVIGDEDISALFNQLFQSSTLIVDRVTPELEPSIQGSAVVFEGTTGIFSLTDVRTRFTFDVVNEKAILIIAVFLDRSWRFTDSFHELRNSVYDDIALHQGQAATDSDNSAPVLLAASLSYHDTTRKVQLTQGVQFYGYLDTSKGALESINWTLPDTPLPAFGPIQYISGQPLTLDIAVGDKDLPALFTDYTLPIHVGLVRTAPDKDDYAVNAIRVSGRIPMGSQPVTVFCDIYSADLGMLTLSVEGHIPLPSPADLLRFFGDSSFMNALPEGYGNDSVISISSLSFGIGMYSRKLEFAKLTLKALENKPLEIIPNGIVSISNLYFDLDVFNPMDSSLRKWYLRLGGTFTVAGTDFDASGTLPGKSVHISLAENIVIDINDIIQHFVPGTPQITTMQITMLDLYASGSPSVSYGLSAEIDDVLSFKYDQMSLSLESILFSIDSTPMGTTFDLNGIIGICGKNFVVSASKPDPGGGWIFAGGLAESEVIHVGDLITRFLGQFDIDFFKPDLDVTRMYLTATLPPGNAPSDQAKTSYTFEGALDWKFELGGNTVDTLAQLSLAYDGNQKTNAFNGYIQATTTIQPLNFKVQLTYYFGRKQAIQLKWAGFIGSYDFNTKIGTFAIENWTFGGLVTELLNIVNPSMNFKLEPPWSVLNDISLNGFKVSIDFNTNDVSVEYALPKKIELGFITINAFKLSKEDGAIVMSIDGAFLGKPIDENSPLGSNNPQDITNLPTVPGAGDQLFELEYLGLGQHVSLYPVTTLHNMEEATTALKGVFKPPQKPKPGQPPILPIPAKPATIPPEPILIFNENSNWLIGSQFTVMKTVALSIIFNDPDLYGMLVQLSGAKAKIFDGLKFEIMYHKVSDSIGVYHVELKLPDAMRHLEFGAVSVTLPIVAIDIYTNGNFKVDFGFPANLDFSRSLTVQAFPFTGSGGFYFAMLNGTTSSRVPEVHYGSFNPVIEFGIGLQLGVGKTIDEGIFSAGLSLTAVGLFEGVIGFYNPNEDSYPGKGEHYYWLQGTFGVVGKLYGSIDFAIISARVDLTLYAFIRATIEAYNAIPLYFEAGVSVSLKVSINLGLFKIHISLKFATTVKASFTIGTDHRSEAPWNLPPGQRTALLLDNYMDLIADKPLKWQPLLLTDEEKEKLNVYFMPHLSISDESGSRSALHSAMLYIDSPADASSGGDTSLDKLTRAVLIWAINACINSEASDTKLDDTLKQTVSADDLRIIYAALQGGDDKSAYPLPYRNTDQFDIVSFLSHYFTVNMIDPESAQKSGMTDLHASIFPMIPDLQLYCVHNQSKSEPLDFSSFNTVGTEYIAEVEKQIKGETATYQHGVERELEDGADQTGKRKGLQQNGPDSLSMATFIFQDYIVLIAKTVIQDAINMMENYRHPLSLVGSLQGIVDYYNQLPGNSLTLSAVAIANQAAMLTSGMQLHIPAISYKIRTADTFQKIVSLYNQGLEENHYITVNDLHTGGNADIKGLLNIGTTITVPGYAPYMVAANDSLTSIAAVLQPTTANQAASVQQVIEAVKDMESLQLFAELEIPVLTYTTGNEDTLQHISVVYGISIDELADEPFNAKAAALFKGPSIIVPSLQSIQVQTIADQVGHMDNVMRISGMSSRYMLHGMRLPDPASLHVQVPLYGLTGQQVYVPANIQATDTYSLNMVNAKSSHWIEMNGVPLEQQGSTTLTVVIDSEEITRIQRMLKVKLEPDTTPLPPQVLLPYSMIHQTYPLKGDIAWHYPGVLPLPLGEQSKQKASMPTLWPFSSLLSMALHGNQPSGGLDLKVKITTQEQSNTPFVTVEAGSYGFATLVNVDIRKLSGTGNAGQIVANTCEVVGADDAGITYLERLIAYINTHPGEDMIDQIHILYAPNPTGNLSNGMTSELSGGLKAALVQSNLSTETNPTSQLRMAGLYSKALTDEPARNTLNPFDEFVKLLWECSIVRSGGYYLYYSTTDGNQGLPDALFNERDSAEISILITYKSNLSKDFVNCAVIADEVDPARSTVFVESESLTTKTANVAPGHIGFQTKRSNPGASNAANADEVYLEHQFNLLGYSLKAGGGFLAQPEALLPIGPTDQEDQDANSGQSPASQQDDDTAPWAYQAVIPVYKFTADWSGDKLASVMAGDENLMLPPAQEDPYAGLGGTAHIGLKWQDMFGNQVNTAISAPDHDVLAHVGYIDAVIGIHQWPSVATQYSFPLNNGQSLLQIEAAFDPSRYTVQYPDKEHPNRPVITQEDAIKNAKMDAITYSRIYYQLIQEDVKVSYRTNLNATAEQPSGIIIEANKNELITFAAKIYTYLQSVIAGSPVSEVGTFTLQDPVHATNTADIFMLDVSFKIERTAHIDEHFTDVESVACNVSDIMPQLDHNDGDAYSLNEFAKQFELTFAGKPTEGIILKLALGMNKDQVSGTDNDKRVWVVRFDLQGNNGIRYTIDGADVYFFSPVPLANHLSTFNNVSIAGYTTGKPFAFGQDMTTKNFSSIDLDTWGRQMLESVDEFLAPNYAVPAYIADGGKTLQSILHSKEMIAEAIVGTMDHVMDKTTSDLSDIGSAQEKFKQQLLIELSNAYKIDAVIQHPVTVESKFNGSNQEPQTHEPFVPRLYGVMDGSDVNPVRSKYAKFMNAGSEDGSEEKSGTTEEYSLSTAKISLGEGSSWLTYLFDTKEADKHSSFTFGNMNYRISHLEHQIANVPDMGDYRASSWLSFIVPLDLPASQLGQVEIPVPLRSYPVPPSIISQESIYQHGGDAGQNSTISSARKWSYAYTYKQVEAAQDHVQTSVVFNVKDEEHADRSLLRQLLKDDPAPKDLPSSLAQWITVYPALKQDLVQYLTKVNVTTGQQDPATLTNALNAMQAFDLMLRNVAQNWSKWNQIHPRNGLHRLSKNLEEAISEDTVTYNIIELPEKKNDPESPLVVRIVHSESLAPTESRMSALASLKPIVSIEGYQTEEVTPDSGSFRFYTQPKPNDPKIYLPYSKRADINTRTVSFEGLDILDTINAWSGVYLTRNDELLMNPDGSYQTTNPKFIYQTPLVRFYNKLAPLLVCNERIDVASIGSTDGASRVLTLAEHIRNLLSHLLENSHNFNPTLKLEVRYNYSLGGASPFQDIELPMLLIPARSIQLASDLNIGTPPNFCEVDNPSLVCGLTKQILGWFNQQLPNRTNGKMVFRADVYPEGNSKLPLLKLADLELGLEYIQELNM